MLAGCFHIKGWQIPEVKAKGKFFCFPFFSLIILKKPLEKTTKFSVLLSTKFNKKAVVRNQVKRKIFEALRLLLAEIKPGHLILFLPRRNLMEKDLTSTTEAIKDAFRNVNVIK